MKSLLCLLPLMLAAELSLAQSASPFFSDSHADERLTQVKPAARPLLESSGADQAGFDVEAVIAESFFRRLRSGITSPDAARKQMTYTRFNLNDDQAQRLLGSIEDWMYLTSVDAIARQEQMCAYWRANSVKGDLPAVAEAAFALHDSLEPDRARIEERLQILLADIESTLGEDFVASLLRELDVDFQRRSNISRSSFGGLVRGTDKAVEHLQFTCDGQ